MTVPARAVLQNLALQNWKSFRDARLHLSELTLLIGANASGKSNALEALKLLRWMASGARLSNFQQATRDAELAIRGNVGDLKTRDSETLESILGGRFAAPEPLGTVELVIGVAARQGDLRVVLEEMHLPEQGKDRPLYTILKSASEVGNVIQVEYDNFKRGGNKPRIDCVDHQAVFTQLATPARFGKEHKKAQELIPLAAESVRSALEGMLFLDPNPAAMRGYAYANDTTLRGDGSNVSGVLHALCQDAAVRESLLEFVSALPEQRFTGIDFVETPRAEVMVQLEETFGGKTRTCDAPLLSDGTLRVLSIAAALLSVSAGTLVVIEEIDNGVHPSRAESLVKMIQQASRQRGLRVLVTTHNPALLDALPNSALPDVTVCFREPDTGRSQLVRLEDLEEYPSLMAQGPLGQLATRGLVDRYVKSREGLEERSEKLRRWLASLREGRADG
ncbi:MAG: ATP-binding protein [Deltaproteobacteria bacterium]|nr:ATP-binding protein [Deltaproteobacteria bacterium]